MKHIATVSLARIGASPAFGEGSRSGELIGTIVAPIMAAISALNINAANNVRGLSGNKTNMPAVAPITLKTNNILSGVLRARSHGCG